MTIADMIATIEKRIDSYDRHIAYECEKLAFIRSEAFLKGGDAADHRRMDYWLDVVPSDLCYRLDEATDEVNAQFYGLGHQLAPETVRTILLEKHRTGNIVFAVLEKGRGIRRFIEGEDSLERVADGMLLYCPKDFFEKRPYGVIWENDGQLRSLQKKSG